MAFLRKHADLFVCLGLGLFSLAIILPFLGHAFHIDEALFLRIARQIQEHPLQPYDFHYLWNSFHEPMHQIAAFPPLFPYYLAAVGWPSRFPSEWLIHLSLVPFAMVALISIYFLGQRFGLSRLDSLLATMIIGTSPAFVVSANMAMPDVAAMSLALGALLVSIRGWKKDRLADLVAGGLLLAAAVLMRYNAAPLVLVYLLLGMTFTATLWKGALPSLICLGGGLAWFFISGWGGGSSHASEVLSLFAKTEGWESRLWSTGIHLTLSTFLPLLALPWLGRRKTFWAMLLTFLTLDFAIYGSSGIKRFAFFPDSLWFAAGAALLLFVGLFLASNLAKVDCLGWSKKREGDELAYELRVKTGPQLVGNLPLRNSALALWVLFLLAVPIIYVHFASKYLLLAQPALALMIFSYVSSPWLRRIAAFSLLPLLALSLSVAWADFSFADLYRREAERVYRTDLRAALTQKISPERAVWFTGHWGWQYYMEKWGGLPLPLVAAREWAPLPGDLIVTSSYASAGDIPQSLSGRLELRESWGRSIDLPLRTMNPKARSGFYSNHWGPLPFNFSGQEAERFNYYLVKPETKLAILP